MNHILQEREVRSIPELLRLRAEQTPHKTAFRFPDGTGWGTLTWSELSDKARRLAAGLRSIGVQPQDRVALLCSTRVDWVIADLGILTAGGATTTIYPSNTAEECAFIINDSDSRVIVVEDVDQLAKIREVADELTGLRNIVLIEGTPPEDQAEAVIKLEDLATKGDLSTIDDVIDAIDRDDLATLIYTSGTTGRPKGVELTHDNWLYASEASSRVGILEPDDVHFLWLPLSHSMGKVLEILMIDAGVETAIDGRVDKIVENLAEIRPTLMAAAPRIFEKVHSVAVSTVRAEGGAKSKIFDWAVKVGTEASRKKRAGVEPGKALQLQANLADKLVFSKVRDRFGGRVRYFISGSAPLAEELCEFFDAAGLTVLEGYGLTESAASTFVNLPGNPKFGTVGPPLEGTELKIADDGEILVKSRGIMRGYHGLAEETDATLKDGWLYTGDLGEVDDDGYLRITGRKKELIKTSGGKYVAPAKIEGLIKAASPYVSSALVHGDRRKYCVALVTLDPDAVAHWATEHGVENDLATISRHPDMVAAVEAAVEEVNSNLASYETIKKVSILPAEFAVETGELTPSMKVKRKVVEERNVDVLDSMYD
ncbi:MAG: long-chain fatty acid--CoA ligase [Acidimicrobiia bacterium]|nr:long-chain fatty acid--CoA ligase [Acidimicrobiia bacterium]